MVRDDTVARDTVGVRVRTCTPRDLSSLANFVSDEEEEEVRQYGPQLLTWAMSNMLTSVEQFTLTLYTTT